MPGFLQPACPLRGPAPSASGANGVRTRPLPAQGSAVSRKVISPRASGRRLGPSRLLPPAQTASGSHADLNARPFFPPLVLNLSLPNTRFYLYCLPLAGFRRAPSARDVPSRPPAAPRALQPTVALPRPRPRSPLIPLSVSPSAHSQFAQPLPGSCSIPPAKSHSPHCFFSRIFTASSFPKFPFFIIFPLFLARGPSSLRGHDPSNVPGPAGPRAADGRRRSWVSGPADHRRREGPRDRLCAAYATIQAGFRGPASAFKAYFPSFASLCLPSSPLLSPSILNAVKSDSIHVHSTSLVNGASCLSLLHLAAWLTGCLSSTTGRPEHRRAGPARSSPWPHPPRSPGRSRPTIWPRDVFHADQPGSRGPPCSTARSINQPRIPLILGTNRPLSSSAPFWSRILPSR